MEENEPKPTTEKDVETKKPVTASNKMKIVWVVIGLIVIIGLAGGAGYYFAAKKDVKTTPTPTASTSVSTTASTSVSPTPSIVTSTSTSASASAVSVVTDEGVTWKSEAEKVTSLDLFNPSEADADRVMTYIDYYLIGTDHSKNIYYANVPSDGLGGSTNLFFIKDDAAHYRFLKNISDNIGNTLVTLKSNVTTDTTTTYKSLTVQDTLLVNGVTMRKVGDSWDSLISLNNHEEPYAQTAYGQMYVINNTETNGYHTQSFILRRPNFTGAYYQLMPSFLSDDNVPQITWDNGTVNKDSYGNTFGTCGQITNGLSVLSSAESATSNLTAVGKTSVGQTTIYALTNTNSDLVKSFYQQYAARDYDSEGNKIPSPNPSLLSIQQFVDSHALITYKDALNRYILLENSKYAVGAECGKPVVYLYPTKTEQVSVKVGAKVSISEPEYNNGWKVTAQPDGRLTNTDGKTYDSLYWEGLGNGIYPAINEGFIVKQSDIETTLKNHLSQLGLNAKESADFLEFWLPRMPKNPYVRLTWFGTQQMNNLAPLNISPKPDTTIRIFLDFEGLQKPVDLPTQKLSTIPRKGFTVIEWGGLLRK